MGKKWAFLVIETYNFKAGYLFIYKSGQGQQ